MSDVRLTALNPDDSSPVPVACDAAGKLLLQDLPEFDGNLDGNLNVTGTGTFGNTVKSSTSDGSYIYELVDSGVNQGGFYQSGVGPSLFLKARASGSSVAFVAINGHDGSATFAGGKAGFTAEGYLFCTTQTGETVVLTSVSGGSATWSTYPQVTGEQMLEAPPEQ